MPGPVSYTKATLSYPIYSAEFDPYGRGYLVVGGGGGEGRSGVENKITLLDATSRSSLEVAAEIELSRDEDSVTSVANLASKDGLITLAGINSSEAEQKAGKNEHLRAFDVKYPKRKRAQDEKDAQEDGEGSITLLAKSALFKPATGPKPETYQRVLRLSPATIRESGNRRIGAVATGLSKNSELVVFDATKSPPRDSEIIRRISLPSEAADLAISNTGIDEFSIAWCTDYDIFEQTVAYDFTSRKAELTPNGPRNVHQMSSVDPAGKPAPRSKYRSIRFLTSHHLLLLSNLPDKKGAELSIVHLYPTGPAMVLLRKTLPTHIKQGIGLDVCALDGDEHGSRQFIVAVGGQDISVAVYTINYNRTTDTYSPFKSFTTLRDVHPLQITALCLSPFHSPRRAPVPRPVEPGKEQLAATPDTTASPPQHPGPQYVRLASTSMGNTVVVDTFALSPLEPTKRTSRYVLSHPKDERWTRNLYIALISFVVLISAILLQSYMYPGQGTGLSSFLPPGARQWLPMPSQVAQGMGDAAANIQSNVEDAVPSAIPSATQRLRDLLHLHKDSETKAVILRNGPSDSTDLSLDVIPDREEYLKQDTNARYWHDLAEHEKETWKQRLIDAGEWTVNEGETILKGVLFSSYAGFVGQVAGEAIREL